ncbi:ASCH domain-containing protein [Antarcticibacterium arcticum]|uniref:ASCH domain-containing protein n=1 Tax=Antarcticibacterium arcticum TaxID=2585771 RepID=A0A5B8YQ56_9FLAO|nr:ASCH domain-containing protein [Antarcticibacterium arcticum]QED38793.1 ASCH domain-containing protein [Antarcticibacterium arcticum]
MKTIEQYWKEFQAKNPCYLKEEQPHSYYYCDNKKDADECAELVVQGIKQATSTSVWWFKKFNEEFPVPGDLAVITNWEGLPKAIVKTTRVEIVKFKEITPEYAIIEGEGDKSLEYWKDVHWKYYSNEMKEHGEIPSEEMEIVCEYFETIG